MPLAPVNLSTPGSLTEWYLQSSFLALQGRIYNPEIRVWTIRETVILPTMVGMRGQRNYFICSKESFS